MADLQNYILSYYQQIRDGRITVGKWVDLIYQRLVEGLESKEYSYDAKKAHHAIDWIEAHCFHTEGDLAPNPLKLELWQKAFLSAVFGLVDEGGTRHFREILLVIGRKNGKSLLGAAIARYIWCTDGFGTRVYNIAPKLDQAEIIYNSIWTMTMLDPEWQEKNRLNHERDSSRRKINEEDPTQERHRMTDLYIPATNSTVKKIAMASKKSDGFNPSATFCDEIASWEGDKGLKQYEVLKSGMGARSQSLLISMTTSGYINDSIYDELVKRSTRFLLGDSKEKRLLPFIYMIDDLEKWNDINELRKSNPNLGVSVKADYLLEEIAIAEGSLSKKSEFLTKYCCIKQNASTAFLRSEDVAKCVGEHLDLNDFRGSYCVGGIDLSRTTDLTACCVVIEKNKKLYVFAKFFLPSEKIDEATARDGVPYRAYVQRGILQPSGENFVDYQDCFDWFRMLVEEYEILPLKVGYDRYNSQYLTKSMQQYGFNMDDVFQGENLTGILDILYGEICNHNLCIGDNDLLKIHLLDSAVKQNSDTMRKRLCKVSGNVHIDGTAALLDALCVRDKWGYEISSQLANEV
ncbi:MAG: terminase large subunit [Lachnospiraceae bacterium]|nr:terminase large subunit [Lachnospiraceae bacterium]